MPLVPVRVFGRRFFLLLGLISIVFYVLALVSRGLAIEPLHLCAAAFLVLYEITLPAQPGPDTLTAGPRNAKAAPSRFLNILGAVFLALAIASAWLGVVREAWHLPQGYPGNPALPYSDTFRIELLLNSAASVLLIGFAVGSMILGHWYLVSSKLSFEPLKRLTGILCLVVLLRLIAAVFTMWSQGEYWSRSLSGGLTDFLLADGLFVVCRFMFGIFLPGVLGVLAWRCARIESNQSATGILYVLVAFVFFGEILSKHFLANQGLGL